MEKIHGVNQKSLPERTADTILSMLHMENYKTGMKLPNEIQMAQRFEVSRSTVRLAEKLLKERGILEIRRGSGTFVSGKLGMPEDPLGLSLVYDKKKLVSDLLELRVLIEPRAAALAAQNAGRRDRELLFSLCEELEETALKGKSYVQKDMEFHQAVANCSGNTVIHNLIPYIHQMLVLYDSVAGKRQVQETLREHREIAEAIAEHRGADAYTAMEFHLISIRSRVISGSQTNGKTNKFV